MTPIKAESLIVGVAKSNGFDPDTTRVVVSEFYRYVRLQAAEYSDRALCIPLLGTLRVKDWKIDKKLSFLNQLKATGKNKESILSRTQKDIARLEFMRDQRDKENADYENHKIKRANYDESKQAK